MLLLPYLSVVSSSLGATQKPRAWPPNKLSVLGAGVDPHGCYVWKYLSTLVWAHSGGPSAPVLRYCLGLLFSGGWCSPHVLSRCHERPLTCCVSCDSQESQSAQRSLELWPNHRTGIRELKQLWKTVSYCLPVLFTVLLPSPSMKTKISQWLRQIPQNPLIIFTPASPWSTTRELR